MRIHLFSDNGNNVIMCGVKRNFNCKEQGALIRAFADVETINCPKCRKILKNMIANGR